MISRKFIVTYMMDGFHEHTTIYADNKREARKCFKEVMGSRYHIVEVEEV